MTTLEILKDAYHLLDDKKHWAKWVKAQTHDGIPVESWDKRAVQWCAIGALERVIGGYGADMREARLFLTGKAMEMYDNGIVEVNDVLGYRQVRAVYRRAIRELESPLVREPPQ